MNVTVTKSEAVSEEEGHVSSRPSGARLAPSLPLLISKVPVTSKNLDVHPPTKAQDQAPPQHQALWQTPARAPGSINFVSRALQTPKKSFQTKSQIYTFRKHIS